MTEYMFIVPVDLTPQSTGGTWLKVSQVAFHILESLTIYIRH